MLTRLQKDQIRTIIQQPQWQSISQMIEELCNKINDEKISKDSEWETIRNVLSKEGQIEGIRRFVQELYNQAQ